MAATFVVEDGTGLSTSNAFASEAEVLQYIEDYGTAAQLTAWNALSSGDQQAKIREASQYLGLAYGDLWKGTRTSVTQAMDFPRYNVITRDGFVVSSTIVPQRVKDATSEAILRLLDGDTLMPDLTSASIKSESVKVGPIAEAITYTGGKPETTRFAQIERLLVGLIHANDIILRG